MLQRSYHGGSITAIAMAKRLCVLLYPSRCSQLPTGLPISARSLSSNTSSTTVEPESAPEPKFITKFKESLIKLTPPNLQQSSGFPLELGFHKAIYGFLGKRKDMSSRLSFVTLTLPHRRGSSIQLVAKPGMRNLKTKDYDRGSLWKLRNIKAWSAVQVSGIVREKQQTKEQRDTHEDAELEILVSDINCLAEFPEDILVSSDKSFGPDQRHLQLRFDVELQKRLILREKVVGRLRELCLSSPDLREVETPILFKSTPEGAREFLVPTRKAGYAYALPQSPQQYKQILMAGGFSGYFQFAKCFRDEDLRADRQPEFTQLDMEFPFHDGDSVMSRVEIMVHKLYNTLRAEEQLFTEKAPEYPFRVMTYRTAMTSYGTDKPDLRIPGTIRRVDFILPDDTKKMLSSLQNPCIDSWRLAIKGDAQKARNFIHQFMESPEGLSFQQNTDGAPGIFVYDPRKPLEGFQAFGHEGVEKLKALYPAEIPAAIKSTNHDSKASSLDNLAIEPAAEPFAEGDILILQAREFGPLSGGSTTLGRLRTALFKAACVQGLVDLDESHHYLWVNHFPLFTPNNNVDPGQGGSAGFSATHHPFTAPKRVKDVDILFTDPLHAIADHYDLVVNGIELGGGSRRIHSAEMQQFVMRDVLKMSEERLKDFSHLFEALRSGCPPHAGFALGLDRLVTVLAGVESVRDVIVFPKNGKGEDALVKSPRLMTEDQLKTYHLKMVDDA